MDLANNSQAADILHQCPKTRHTLSALAEMATAAGADFIAREALELAERVAAEPFFVACVGEPKRGKPTLISALLGTPILPTGVVPIRAIATIFRYGSSRAAKVHLADGSLKQISLRTVASYVSEDCNPANRKGIAAIEVFIPNPLLASGICLVHAPGLASLSGGNHAVIRTLIPRCDAAVVVLGADPPISISEIALIDEVADRVTNLLFVLKKVDRLRARACDDAVAAAQRILTRHFARPVGPLFRVSAYRWLNEIKSSASGFDEGLLATTLAGLAKESGQRLLRAAERRGLTCLAPAILAELERVSDCLVRPVKESRRRVSKLSATIGEAERLLDDLSGQFKIERAQIFTRTIEQRDRFLSRAMQQGLDDFREKSTNVVERRGLELRDRVAAIAEEVAGYWLELWLTEQTSSAEAMYQELSERFVKMANDFLEHLANFDDRVSFPVK
jgi:hypothetical protein